MASIEAKWGVFFSSKIEVGENLRKAFAGEIVQAELLVDIYKGYHDEHLFSFNEMLLGRRLGPIEFYVNRVGEMVQVELLFMYIVPNKSYLPIFFK
jgi:hypothetical protein